MGKHSNKTWRLRALFARPLSEVRNVGFITWLGSGLLFRGGDVRLMSGLCRYPLHFRPHSSDVEVFAQVFGAEQYRVVKELAEPRLIIDCGANVGFSAAYFLTYWPKARLIAVEPDPDNFRILVKNMQPYCDRVTLVNSAVWSHSCDLVISDEVFRDGREWTRQVRPCREGEKPQMVGADIGSLLRSSGFDRISILKLDVEGAEKVIFSANYESWIDKCDTILIELHDGECERIFLEAIANRGFQVTTCKGSEITIAQRVSSVVGGNR